MRTTTTLAWIGLSVLGACLPVLAQRTPLPLNDYARLGERITAPHAFSAVAVCVPSWSDNEGGLTLTLWDSPARTKMLAQRVVTGVGDNAMVEARPAKPLPAGTYYWEVSDRTGQTQIGLYYDPVPPSDNCAYLDGKPERGRRFVFDLVAAGRPRQSVRSLIAAVSSGSAEEKSAACRELAVAGNASAVPALGRLLDDREQSHMARFAMERIPGKVADAALREALTRLRGRQLVGAINSVAVRRDAGAIGRLAALVKSSDAEVASAAAVALGRIGTPQAAAVLVNTLAWSPSAVRPAVYEGCLSAAGVLLAAGDRKQAVALYDRLRSARAPVAIRTGATRGALIARGPNSVQLLRRLLHSADGETRGAALWVAQREMPGRTITLALASEVRRLASDVQPTVIAALAGRGDAAAMAAIEGLAYDGAKPVRLAAVQALPAFGDAAASGLAALLSGTDADVRQASADALARLPASRVEYIASGLMRSPHPLNRLGAITLMHRMRLPGCGALLASALADTAVDVRVAAATALAEMAGWDQAPSLRTLLLSASDAGIADLAERALITAAGKASDKETAARYLADAMGQGTPARRAGLVRVIGTIGGRAGLEAVRAALVETDGVVHTAALDALCAWQSEDAAPDLLRLARGASTPAESQTCLRGLLRIAAIPDVPSDRRLALCRETAGLVQRDEERWLLLSALGGVGTVDALGLVTPHIDAAGTREEACAAVLAIADRLVAGPEKARLAGALERVAGVSTNPETVKRAQALLEQAR